MSELECLCLLHCLLDYAFLDFQGFGITAKSYDMSMCQRLCVFPFSFSDLDECDLGTHKCPAHSECVNTQGNYKCRCQSGYHRVGSHCEGTHVSACMHMVTVLGVQLGEYA